jgi:hypothetical protein
MSTKRREHQLKFRIGEEEYQALLKAYQNTAYQSKSEYVRRLLTGGPVTTIYRNRSLDDFIELGVKLRKELRLLLARNSWTNAEKEALKTKIDVIEDCLLKIVETCTQK